MPNNKESSISLTSWVQRQVSKHPLWSLACFFLFFYSASLLTVKQQGVIQSVPWQALYLWCLAIVSFAIPSFVMAEVETLRSYSIFKSQALRIPLSIAFGLTFLVTFQQWQIWLLICIVIIFFRHQRKSLLIEIKSLSIGILTLIIGYAIIWNLNYLLALSISDRLLDPLLWKIDLRIYSWLFGYDVSFEGLFPIIKDRSIFALLEASYFAVLPEVGLVLILKVREGDKEVSKYLARLFIGYLIAVVCFFLLPAVGPCFVQSSMDVAYQGSQTFSLMQGEVYEFKAIQHSLPLGGVAYFIALPSMHVGVASLLQILLRPTPILFWAFLPINVLCILSTILLGYHYILDVPAGLLVTALLFVPDWLASHRSVQSDNVTSFSDEPLEPQPQ